MSNLRVILAEKPSMGRAIAAAIGLPGDGKNLIRGTDTFGNPTIVTWAVGHLVEAVEPEDYDKSWAWQAGWSVLPMIPPAFKYRVVPKTKDQFDVIKEQLAKATEVVVATDAGREGELIASLILDKAKCKAETLRLWTGSLTEIAIQKAYAEMKPWSHYKGLRDAAYGRSMADWIVGMNGSRGMTFRARSLGRTEKGAWSVGRVMTPTLAILVDRELEIRNFVSKDYFVVEGTFEHPAGTYKGKWFKADKDRFDKLEDAKALLDDLSGRPAKVTKFETKEVRKGPEQFYDLTAIQKEANKRFGFSAEKTLGIAQDLYEKKVLSYPRTGSRFLTEADAKKIPAWLRTLKGLLAYSAFVDEIKGTNLGKRFVDDSEVEDHTALMPTEEKPNWDSLSPDEQKIYDMVARRFLAAFYPDRIEAKTILVTEIQGAKGPETFKTTGTAVINLGWSKVDAPAQSKARKANKGAAAEDEDEDKPLTLSGAPVHSGDHVGVKSLGSEAKKTNPPKRMTEADLLQAMQTAGKDLDEEELRDALKECSGIGTPATRAATIEKLLDKGTSRYPKAPFVERQKNFLVPTQKGIDLIEMIPFKDLRSAELTGRWESNLDQVAKGKGRLTDFMSGIYAYTQEMINACRDGAAATDGASMPSNAPRFEPKKLDDPCPKCGKTVYLKAWEGRYYTACESKGSCYFGYDSDSSGKALNTCKHCRGRVKTVPNKGQVCADCGKWQNDRAEGSGGGGGIHRASKSTPQTLGKCPKCSTGTLRLMPGSNGSFVSCSNRDKCDLSYSSDEAGLPAGGKCPKCQGPVKLFPSGSKKCAVCGEWVNDKPRETGNTATSSNRPPKPPNAKCPYDQGVMEAIWTKQSKWTYKCQTCGKWHDIKEKGA